MSHQIIGIGGRVAREGGERGSPRRRVAVPPPALILTRGPETGPASPNPRRKSFCFVLQKGALVPRCPFLKKRTKNFLITGGVQARRNRHDAAA
jgi:hypothetical protein